MELDPILLSRLQFAFVVAFHFLLPAFTVGLASYIAVLEGLHFTTRAGLPAPLEVLDQDLRGVVRHGRRVRHRDAVPVRHQLEPLLGCRRPTSSAPLMAYEGLMAFFLEAGFLGVLLFGRKRVPPWVHFVAAVMVAVGTLLSTFWILAVNSWMQTPGRHSSSTAASCRDWMRSSSIRPFRTASCTRDGVFSHHRVRRGGRGGVPPARESFVEESLIMLKMGLGLASDPRAAAGVVGDLHGLNTLEHQPAKIAAIEANWDTGPRQPLLLFAWPDESAERNRFEIAIPALASSISRTTGTAS